MIGTYLKQFKELVFKMLEKIDRGKEDNKIDFVDSNPKKDGDKDDSNPSTLKILI